MVGDSGGYGWRGLERLVNSYEVVVHEVKGSRGGVVSSFFEDAVASRGLSCILVGGTRATKVHEELGHGVLRGPSRAAGCADRVPLNETTDYCGTSL